MNSSHLHNSVEKLDNDVISYAKEDEEISASETKPAWKILIADDEQDVHYVTKLILDNFKFKDRALQFIDAYSGEEACRLLQEHPDIAVILLDVVMESEHAGLHAVRRIREELGNTLVRIILRTGQPGVAPEQSVITDYDINDYKSKIELTSQIMYTAMVASLRSYSDLKALDTHRRGVLKILEASSQLDLEALHIFVTGLLAQLNNILEAKQDELILIQQNEDSGLLQIIAAIGNYEPFIGNFVQDVLSQEICQTIQEVIASQKNLIKSDYGVYVVADKSHGNVVAYGKNSEPLGMIDLALVSIFCEESAAGLR